MHVHIRAKRHMSKRDARGRFLSGTSGNPDGKPKGARNRATLAAQCFLEGEAKKLARKAVELALDGDTVALRLCLERILPRCRSAPLLIDLPALGGAQEVVAASAELVHLVTQGSLPAAEAESLGRLLELHRRSIETQDLAARVADMEKRLGIDERGVDAPTAQT